MNRTQPARRRKFPTATALLMLATVLAALYLLDWTNTGQARPFWMFFVPLGLGSLGTVFGIRADRPGWAVASGLLGVLIVPALMVVVLVLGGP